MHGQTDAARRRGILARLAGGLALAGAVAAAGAWQLHAASRRALEHTDAPFVVCFVPARPTAPDAAVRSRVEAFDALLDGLLTSRDAPYFRAFAKAIVTHESGGDAGAISPTGCAGAAAIAAPPPGHTRCCEIDDDDDYRYGYDKCNSEARRGYRCTPDDPRFTREYAAGFAVDRFRRIRGRMAGRRGAQAPDPRVMLPMAWNAGLGVFPSSPQSMHSPEAAIAQLNFAGKEPYASFRVRGHVNKVVEIHDYLVWFAFLADYWDGRPSPPSPPAALSCVRYEGGPNGMTRVRGAVRPALVGLLSVSASVQRLSFGRYEPAEVYFASGVLRRLVWWVAAGEG